MINYRNMSHLKEILGYHQCISYCMYVKHCNKIHMLNISWYLIISNREILFHLQLCYKTKYIGNRKTFQITSCINFSWWRSEDRNVVNKDKHKYLKIWILPTLTITTTIIIVIIIVKELKWKGCFLHVSLRSLSAYSVWSLLRSASSCLQTRSATEASR